MGLDIYLHRFTTKENVNARDCRVVSKDFLKTLNDMGVETYEKDEQYYDIKNPEFKYNPNEGWDCGAISVEDGVKTLHFRREKDGKLERAEAVVGVDEIPILTQREQYFCYEEPELFYQRKGMNPEFYDRFLPSDIIIDRKTLEEMVGMSEDREYTKEFLDKFIEGETFVLIDY